MTECSHEGMNVVFSKGWRAHCPACRAYGFDASSEETAIAKLKFAGIRGSLTDEIAKLKAWATHCGILSDDRGYHSPTILALIERVESGDSLP